MQSEKHAVHPGKVPASLASLDVNIVKSFFEYFNKPARRINSFAGSIIASMEHASRADFEKLCLAFPEYGKVYKIWKADKAVLERVFCV